MNFTRFRLWLIKKLVPSGYHLHLSNKEEVVTVGYDHMTIQMAGGGGGGGSGTKEGAVN